MLVRLLTPTKALEGVAIGNYIDVESGTLIIAYVNRCIVEIMQHFNVPAMSESQIEASVNILMDKFPDWSVEDFAVFSKTVRMGNVNGIEYPKSFHRIDPDMINQFADTYNLAKIEAREKKIQKEKSDRFLFEKQNPIDTSKIPSLKPFIEKFEQLKKETKPLYVGNKSEMIERLGTPQVDMVNAVPILQDPTEKMKQVFDANLKKYGVDFMEKELARYNKSLMINEEKPEWIKYAEREIDRMRRLGL